MSYIGKNIKKIRNIKKLNQSQFAELFSLSRTSVGSYEEGRAEPKIETIITIANYFGISIDMLLSRELTVNDLYQFDMFKIELEGRKKQSDFPDIELKRGNTMRLVQLKDQIEYIERNKEKTYIESLLQINLPLKLNITTRAFEHAGNEMEHNGQGIFHGDTLICQPVNIEKTGKLEEEEIYCLILKNSIITKRLTSINKNRLTFKSDNPNYGDVGIKIEDIVEIWKLDGVFSTHIVNPSNENNRLNDLEQKMAEIMKKIIATKTI